MQFLAEPRARGIFTGRVLSNDPICPEHYRIRIGLANFPPSRPGQFVNIRCGTTESVVLCPSNNMGLRRVAPSSEAKRLPRRSLAKAGSEAELVGAQRPCPADTHNLRSAPVEGATLHYCSDRDIKVGLTSQPTSLSQAETVGRVPLLRRPFSLAGRADAPDKSVELEVLYRVVGAGTAWMAGLETGAEIDLIGPLGNGFAICEDKPLAAVIGGGTGIGPMIYIAEALASAGKDVSAFAGARTASAMPLTKRQKGTFAIATDDGSLGQTGMVHQAFSRWLEREKPAPANMVVYACGPEPMMKAVADICLADGIECQLAMERHMACGMGVCQGCAIKIKTDEPPGWTFKLVCKNGPVFDAEELVW